MKNMLILLLILMSCKHKPSKQETETGLKNAMTSYLYKQANVDSTMVKYDVLQVNFTEDNGLYNCSFKVHLHENRFDTTGFMKATVSKDFATVHRLH